MNVAAARGVALNRLMNVAVAEKVSALRTEEYFAERAKRADVNKALKKSSSGLARDSNLFQATNCQQRREAGDAAG